MVLTVAITASLVVDKREGPDDIDDLMREAIADGDVAPPPGNELAGRATNDGEDVPIDATMADDGPNVSGADKGADR